MSYKAEVITVKELGEAIGYGNMMDIASMLWEIDMIRKSYPVPKRLRENLNNRGEERRNALIEEIIQYV